MAAISGIDPTGAFDDSNEVRAIVQEEFEREAQQILSDTADHYGVTRAIIRSIAKARPKLALDIINRLNLENRRDSALTDLVNSLLELPGEEIPIEFLRGVLGQFADKDEEDSFISGLLRRVSRVSQPTWLKGALPQLRVFIARARDIINPVLACSALSAALVVLAKLNDSTLSGLQAGVVDTLKRKWESTDDPSERLKAGYETVRRLADYQRELALSYLADTDSLRHSHQDLTDSTFLACLLLAIRAYSGLLPGKLEVASDFDRLALQLERVPSRMYRVYLWTELALRCFSHERSDDAKKIVAQKVRPLLDTLKEESPHEWRRATALAAPAMWESNAGAASEYVSQLPQQHQDVAFERILHFKLTRVPPGDPYASTNDSSYQLDLDKCVEILKIVEHVDVDFTAYKYIEAVARSAASQHGRFALSQTQKSELADRIKRLSAQKFPNSRFIVHEGFAILAEGQAVRLLKEKSAQWPPLVVRAKALTNAADRAFVLAFLADMMHSGLASERIALLRESKLAADAVPALIDRVDRYRLIAGVAFDLDQAFARQLFSEAMNSLAQKNTQECEEARRQLVDSAYQVDEDLASSLASSLDNDEARKSARKRIEFQNAQKKLIESPAEPDRTLNPYTTSRLFWQLLGKLNAGRVSPRDVAESLRMVLWAGNFPLRLSFPVLSWVIENAIVKRGHADEAKRLLREMYEGMLNSCEIAAAVLARAVGMNIPSMVDARASDEERVIVTAGNRDRGLNFIRNWLRSKSSEYLWICDPYFGLRDLEAFQLVLECNPGLRVTVVTSRKHQEDEKVDLPLDATYSRYWTKHFSDQNPPQTEFVIVGTKSGQLPIHDRWWLTKGAGLRLGTSFNGLGVSRDSEISALTESEVAEREAQTSAYLNRQKKEHLGERLSYQFFEI